MAATFCSTCGGPLRSGAAFCPKCGATVVASTVVTAPSTVTPSTPKSAAPEPTPLKPSHRTRNLIVVILAVLVILAAGLSVYWYEYQPGGPLNPHIVKVTQVVWTEDGAAWTTGGGFSLHAGKQTTVSASEYCAPGEFIGPYAVTCSLASVYILTAGFGLVSTNAPFSWSSGTTGASATVNVTVSLPNSSYTGPLDIDLH